jgi:aldehyde dehydrogenase (NAD+)
MRSTRRWAHRLAGGGPQVGLGLGHLATAMDALKNFEFEEQRGSTLVVKEPIGVCAV